jgi:hypothetical protein
MVNDEDEDEWWKKWKRDMKDVVLIFKNFIFNKFNKLPITFNFKLSKKK